MTKPGVAVVLSVCAVALMFNACGKKAEQSNQNAPANPQTKLTIGVSLLTRTHPFYQELEAGLKEAAAANGYELLITAGEFDVAKQ